MKKLLTCAVLAAAGSAPQAAVLTALDGLTSSVLNTSVHAVAVAGAFSGNDTGNASTVRDTLDTLAAHFGSHVPGGTGAWTLWDKTDSTTGSPRYSFSNNPQTPTGTLRFDAPVTGWFAVTLKAGNQFSMVLFDGGLAGIDAIDYSTLGTSVNHRGQPQNLSHASLWGGTPAGVPVPLPVPEPGAGLLSIAGLAALGWVRRRRPLS